MEKKKNPDRVKGGKMRWKGVSKKERQEYASKNGIKGSTSLWNKYELTKKNEEVN